MNVLRKSGLIIVVTAVCLIASCDMGTNSSGGGNGASDADPFLDRIPVFSIDLTPVDSPSTNVVSTLTLDRDGSTDDLYAELADGLDDEEAIEDVVNFYIPVINMVLDQFKSFVEDNQPDADTVYVDGTSITLFGVPHDFDSVTYSVSGSTLTFYYTITIDSSTPYYVMVTVSEIAPGSDTWKTTYAGNFADFLDLIYFEYYSDTGNVVAYEEYEEEYDNTDPPEPAINYNYRLYEIVETVDADAAYVDYREMSRQVPDSGSTWSDGESEVFSYLAVSSRSDGIEVYEEGTYTGGSDNVYAKVNAANDGVGAAGPLSGASAAFQTLLTDWGTTARAAIASFDAQTLIPDPSDSVWDSM
jgi:hypothetical protein